MSQNPLAATLDDTVNTIEQLLDATQGKPAGRQLDVLMDALRNLLDELDQWSDDPDHPIPYILGLKSKLEDRIRDLA